MKIALLDLNHNTIGIHTNTVPYGIGLIANYTLKNLNVEIKLFKTASNLDVVLESWHPDILGITQYIWNSELNLYYARKIKVLNPDCVVIAGGPNLSHNKEEKKDFLKVNNTIDICISFDGEIPFTEILKRLDCGDSIDKIKRKPSPGTYSLHPDTFDIVESSSPPPRLETLDVFGPIYSQGFFDRFLDDGFHPFLQTHRGCPFTCSYCHTSHSYYNKMLFQSDTLFQEEMEYLGKKFENKHQIVLYIANTNFGLFDQDERIAQVLRSIQDKYNWPKLIDIGTCKDTAKLLKILSILKYRFKPAISLQTLTPQVLKKIKRYNVTIEEFIQFQKTILEKYGEKSATELIMSLPEETKDSFIKTISEVIDIGVQDVVIYTLMSLKGTPIYEQIIKSKYKQVICYRIVPRQFSEIAGNKIFEIEEVVVSTNTMSFDDYLFIRGIALIISSFSSEELYPIRKFIQENQMKLSRWFIIIHDNISKYTKLLKCYNEFLAETTNELFQSRESIIAYFNETSNYEQLCNGTLGDNLIRKYKTILLRNNFTDCLTLAIDTLKIVSENQKDINPDTMEKICEDLQQFLITRDMDSVFENGYDNKITHIHLNFDIPDWLSTKNMKISCFNKAKTFKLVVSDYMKQRLESYIQMNRNKELSIQMLYRDGYIKEFWPLWIDLD